MQLPYQTGKTLEKSERKQSTQHREHGDWQSPDNETQHLIISKDNRIKVNNKRNFGIRNDSEILCHVSIVQPGTDDRKILEKTTALQAYRKQTLRRSRSC